MSKQKRFQCAGPCAVGDCDCRLHDQAAIPPAPMPPLHEDCSCLAEILVYEHGQKLVKQHLPGYVDRHPQTGWFHDLDSLLEVPFVKRWYALDHTFHRWSISQDAHSGLVLLIAEFDEGEEWWVIAYLELDHGLDLPTWRHPATLPGQGGNRCSSSRSAGEKLST